MLAGNRRLTMQGARELERFQRACLSQPKHPADSLVNLADIPIANQQHPTLLALENNGFCCDRSGRLSDANNAILISDEAGRIVATNYQGQQLSGYTLEALLGMNIQDLGLNHDGANWEESPQIDTYLRHRSGAAAPVEALRTPARQGSQFSTMYILRKRELESSRAAPAILEDPLTHLPNRQAFTEQLRNTISNAANHTQQVAVLVIDLNAFQPLQRQIGLEASQALLCEVTQRLRQSIRLQDYLARLGEDEFGLILENLPQTARSPDRRRKAVGAIRNPF